MHEFIIFTIGGLATASIYAITASGLTLTYTTTGIFNWSHGAIGMLAAFVYWQLHVGWGWNTLLSFAVCLFVFAPALGVILEIGVMRRLEGTSEAAKLVVTLALALAMVALAQWIWNPQTFRTLTPLFASDTLVLGPIRISYNDLIVLGVALAVAVGLRLLLYRTRMGVTMRASVDDRKLTVLNGASSVRSARSAWIVGCMLAALAGILVAPTVSLSATALTLLIVDAYAASVIGRLRSIPMTFVGAIILGLAVSYSVAYLPQNSYIQGFEGAVPAIVLFAALLLLPQSRLRGHRLLRSRELAFVPSWRGTGYFAIGRHRGRLHDRQPGVAVRPLQPQPGVGTRHHWPVLGASRRLRRSPLAVSDDLRGDRSRRHGAPGRRREPARPLGRHRSLCFGRNPRGPTVTALVRDLFRPGHGGIRHRHGRLGVSSAGLQPVRHPIRALRDRKSHLCPVPRRGPGRREQTGAIRGWFGGLHAARRRRRPHPALRVRKPAVSPSRTAQLRAPRWA